MEPVGHLDEYAQELWHRQSTRSQGRSEALAFEQIHHDVEAAALELAEIADLDDVSATNRVGRLRLANEALKHALRPIHSRLENLHRRSLADDDVPARVDRTHPAPADEALDFVAPVDGLAHERLGPRADARRERDERDAVLEAMRRRRRVVA